jgi:sterol desaturase/sphingolipid hydroxylase (fatty acid hydroxylase superfamily)
MSIFSNSLFYFFYRIEHPTIEQYKVSNVEWPWKENPTRWKRDLPKLVKLYLLNYVVMGSPFISLAIRFAKPRYDLDSLPSAFEFSWQIFFSVFCEDFFFYWSHRLLHTPFLYKRIHKVHHEYYNTIAPACIYTHPVELVIGNIFPMMSALLCLRSNMHAVTLAAWIPMRIYMTHDGHSGYDFPLSPSKALPFASTSVYHNYHHLKNIGNYGSSLRIWDHLFGTNLTYLEEQKANMENKNK